MHRVSETEWQPGGKTNPVCNLRGTIFSGNTPVFKFKFDSHKLVSYTALTDIVDLYPFEWRDGVWKNPGQTRLIDFFNDRVPPTSRSDYISFCHNVGIPEGDKDSYLQVMRARCIKDELYLVCEN